MKGALLSLLLLLVAAPVVAAPTDLGLYRDITAEVHEGRSYYAAAARLHRRDNYPLRPFVTVRPPTLSLLIAAIGPAAALAVLGGLLLAAALAWFTRLQNRFERYGAAFLVCFTSAPALGLVTVYQHEIWAGVLTTLSLAFFDRRPVLAVLWAVLAVLVRDIAIVYFLALAAASWRDARARRAAAVGLAVVAIFYAFHAAMVASVVAPGDPGSPGWLGLRGPLSPVADLRPLTWLGALPLWPAAIVCALALAGWLLSEFRALAGMWFGGFLLIVMTIARRDNDYWVALMLPGFLIGLVFVPRLARNRVGTRTPEPA